MHQFKRYNCKNMIPVIKDGAIVPGQMMALSLSFDHRIIDGGLAQRFVNDIKRLLENPRLMLMEV